MKLSDIDLNLLVAFEALALELSVTRAARRVGVGQPAMSDALRRLRLMFGDPLFIRAGAGMRMTATASVIVPDISVALDRVRRVLGEQAPFEPAASCRTFSIASTDYTTLVLLPGIVEALSRDAAGLDLRIVAYDKDTVPGLLASGEVDLVLGVLPDAPDTSVRTDLFTERFIGVARMDHPVFEGRPRGDDPWGDDPCELSLEAYAALPHALVSVRRDAHGALDLALAAHGLKRRIALVLPFMLLLPPILARSDLIAALPWRAAVQLSAEAGLRLFHLPLPVPEWHVSMVWNAANRSDRGLSYLRRVVMQAARDLEGVAEPAGKFAPITTPTVTAPGGR